MASLLDRIPARTPLELRDRAMLELAYSCGLRAQEVVDLDLDSPDFEGERLRVEGKGSQDAVRADGRARPAGAAPLPGARPPRRSAGDAAGRDRRCSLSKSGRRLHPSDLRRRLRAAGSARRRSPAASRPTRCATPSRPTCWRAERTCARSRSCSDTPASRPRRSTPEWSRHGCGRSTLGAIRVPEQEARNDAAERRVEESWLRLTSRRSSCGSSGAATRTRRRQRARAARGRLLAPGQVRRRPHRRAAALARRAGRPDLLRDDRPDRGDGPLRARAPDPLRDLRHAAHPRRDHRRAALARLGAALGALPRPRDRGGATPSSSTSSAVPRPTPSSPSSWRSPRTSSRSPCSRSRTPRSSPSRSCG